MPRFAATARSAESADVVGDVSLAGEVSVWYGAVVRGDMSPVTVGERTNIQDNAVLHGGTGHPLTIGRDVTVGHGAIVHGCTVGENCLIGMGAILLNGCVIGPDSLIAAGALVPQDRQIPPRSLVMGAPGKVVRALTDEEVAAGRASAAEYLALAEEELPLLDREGGA